MKRILIFSLIFGLFMVLPVAAQPDLPDVVFLGKAKDPKTGKVVEGIKFIHYKKTPTHKPQHGSKGGGGGTCFAYLSNGAKWKTVESWVVNTTNADSLTSDFVFSKLTSSFGNWEDGTDGVAGNSSGINVFGDGTITAAALVADTSSPDGSNEIYFDNISEQNVIAVTTVWGIFIGPPSGRELVEFDMVYDDPDFLWGDAGPTSETSLGDTSIMDFENIAMHELGHAFGMSHPSDTCAQETMYRFSEEGETKKRTLNAGDIAGINGLY